MSLSLYVPPQKLAGVESKLIAISTNKITLVQIFLTCLFKSTELMFSLWCPEKNKDSLMN